MALVELTEVQGGVAGALDLVGGAVQVEDELGRDDADQYQHDQADTLLAVVGAMDEAYRHGGKHQHQAVPERRVLLLVEFATGFRGLVHLRQRTPPLQSEQDQRGDHEAGQRREDQRQADVDRLLPVDPFGQRHVGDQRIGQADTEDRADQGVRAGGRDAEVPGAEVPGDGGGEQGEDHRQAMAGVHVDQQLHRQQVNDGVGHADTAEQHAEEVEHTGEHHRPVGGHRFGVDDGGHRVGSVVEAVDELEGEDEGQGQHQADTHPGIEPAEKIEHVRNRSETGRRLCQMRFYPSGTPEGCHCRGQRPVASGFAGKTKQIETLRYPSLSCRLEVNGMGFAASCPALRRSSSIFCSSLSNACS